MASFEYSSHLASGRSSASLYPSSFSISRSSSATLSCRLRHLFSSITAKAQGHTAQSRQACLDWLCSASWIAFAPQCQAVWRSLRCCRYLLNGLCFKFCAISSGFFVHGKLLIESLVYQVYLYAFFSIAHNQEN